MIAAVSSGLVILGGCLACAGLKQPDYQATFERWGGALLVTGLTLLGSGLGIRP